MYLDKRNNNKVTIIKDISKSIVMVKIISSNKRYLVEKNYLQEIKLHP